MGEMESSILDNLKQKSLLAVRDVFVGLSPLLIGILICAALFFLVDIPELGILALIAVPVILYSFVPVFSRERNFTVRGLHGIVSLATMVAIVIFVWMLLLGLFEHYAQVVPQQIEHWSVERSEAKLAELRECYFDSQCVLSSDELAELKRLEEKQGQDN